jgi:hypothetical protein
MVSIARNAAAITGKRAIRFILSLISFNRLIASMRPVQQNQN